MSETKSESADASNEQAKTAPSVDVSLGKYLAAAREKRGFSREEAIKQTRLPEHYLRMLENDDYSMISDQLYLLPFLRRYSTFLQLDPEETAMRFVREVQRADNNAPAARMDSPLEPRRRKNRNWSKLAIVAALLAVIVIAYVAESRHHASADGVPAVSAPAAPAAPTSATGSAKTESPARASSASAAGSSATGQAAPTSPPAPQTTH